MKPETTVQERIDIINKIIKEIAFRGRKFFLHKENIAFVYQGTNNGLYMVNEYNGHHMSLSPKNTSKPEKWTHGGTLWALTQDFRDYILTGDKTNHDHGYGGLYCTHWGYPDDDMIAIQKLATELGYL